MKFGVWTPLPHTVAPEPRMAAAVSNLSKPGAGEGRDDSFQMAIDVLKKGEAHGFVTTLIAARHLGPDLEAWTLATALAMHTSSIEIMVATHPGIIQAQMVAKLGASLDRLSNGRLALNVVNGWNVEEFETFGNCAWQKSEEERYQRMDEFIQVIRGLWESDPFTFKGQYYRVKESRLPLKPRQTPHPPIYAASRSPEGKRTIARYCDHWFPPDLGDFRKPRDTLAFIAKEIDGMRSLANSFGNKIGFGLSANVVCEDSEDRAVEKAMMLEEHGRKARYNKSAVAALGPCLVGTAQTIAERICAYEDAGLDLLLLQFNPMEQGLDRFLSEVLPLVEKQRGPPAAKAANGRSVQQAARTAAK
jgi:FMNH2-dependent dimethyl sulfone monooxygenase